MLEGLGFSQNEEKVYTTLLRNKMLNGYEIAKLSGVSRSLVYEVVNRLVGKGILIRLEGEPNYYIPLEYDKLIARMKKESEEAIDRAEEFLEHLEDVKEFSKKYEMPVGAIGRWGSNRICKEGTCQDELELEYRLIDSAAELGCGVYITGCNYVEELSYYENCGHAIHYFEKLIAHWKEKGVKIATYNCR